MGRVSYFLLIMVCVLLAACAARRPDVGNISYKVEGQPITPQSDHAWRYVGDTVRGDLNGDGIDDLALLLVNESGGSGTFYYLAAALAETEGYDGTNALLLGDRIAPRGIVIAKGVITVNYAERVAGASFSEVPTANVTKYFKVKDKNLYRTYVISQITHRKWQWLQTKMSDDALITPRQVEAFTLVLREDGVVMGTSDCNRFSGSYTSKENNLVFGNVAATRMYCENSQEADFLKQLNAVESYFIDDEGRLVLQLKFDSGSMIFR